MRFGYPGTLLLCVMLLSACISETASRGYVLNEEALASLQAGSSNRQDVFEALGSPSSSSDFEKERWHYIGKVVKQKSVLDPTLEEQDIVTIAFDKNGVVESISRKSRDDAQTVEMIDRTTPTRGHSIGVVEQLIGNFGRFNNQVDSAPQ